jgi:hypothetical protein
VRTYPLGALKIWVAENQSQLGGLAAASMDGYSSSGNWKDLNLNTSPAKVKKDYNTQTITVTVEQSDVPTASMTDTGNALLSKTVGAYFHVLSNILPC